METLEVSSECQETLFQCEITDHWHRLPREVVESPSTDIFRNHLAQSWALLEQGIGQDNLPVSLPTSTVL